MDTRGRLNTFDLKLALIGSDGAYEKVATRLEQIVGLNVTLARSLTLRQRLTSTGVDAVKSVAEKVIRHFAF